MAASSTRALKQVNPSSSRGQVKIRNLGKDLAVGVYVTSTSSESLKEAERVAIERAAEAVAARLAAPLETLARNSERMGNCFECLLSALERMAARRSTSDTGGTTTPLGGLGAALIQLSTPVHRPVPETPLATLAATNTASTARKPPRVRCQEHARGKAQLAAGQRRPPCEGWIGAILPCQKEQPMEQSQCFPKP